MRVLVTICFLAFLSCIFAQIDQAAFQTQQQNHFVGQDQNAGGLQNPDSNNQQDQQHNFQQQDQPLYSPQEAVSVQNFDQVPNQQLPQQQKFNDPPQPQQPDVVQLQQPDGMPLPQQVMPQPQIMQHQFNVPPIEQPGQPNAVPLQKPIGVPQPQAVPQQPPVVPLQSMNPQVPQQYQPQVPVQPPGLPPLHIHNEETLGGYDHHGHNSLPLKPRQKKYEPPVIVNNDNELDFYSRLPSPLGLVPEIDNVAASLRPFLALTVNVTPGVKDCYFYEAPTSFVVDVQVIGSEGGMDIGLTVFDPSGLPIVRRDPTGDTSVTISVQPQFRERAYAVCLDNRKASYGRKKVYLGIDLHIDWHNPNSVEKEVIGRMKTQLRTADRSMGLLTMFDNLDRVTDSLDRISGLLHRSQRLQQRTRNNLAADRAMMQANRDRVTSWSTFQACALVLVGIFQTLLIRSLFDTNSSLHRLWIRGGRGSIPVPSYSTSLRY